MRIRLTRQARGRHGWMLEIPYLSLDEIVFHEPGQPGIRTGSAQPVSTRPFPDRFYVFPIEIGTEPATYYLQCDRGMR